MYENEIENIASRGTNEEIYYGLLELTKNAMQQRGKIEGKKKLYYISAEFLIGKLLSNNLINLGLYDQVEDALKKHGKSMAEIEEIEPEPSLGNGGLGRLAACFDSIASLGLNGDGVGINYHLGLFKQEFDKNLQKEVPNPWIKDKSWLRRTDTSYEVIFGGLRVNSVMYEIDVTGYDNKCNTLKLFDIDSVDENIVQGESIYFNKEDIRKNLTLFLYPDDSDYQGQLLRIYQQYFMVSNAAQLIIDEAAAKGSNLYDLADYAVVQINDTHPTMVIPELIRLLVKKGIDMDRAIDIVSSMCAYTNHTILAEALEKWPVWFLDKVVPQLMPIIKMLDVKVKEKYNNNPELAIIDENQQVHMARIDMHYGFSVNGVAALHTEILKNSELKPFYDIYPNKFNNKTNGITFRRWLLHSNHELTGLISSKIGDGFKKDANELEKLMQFKDDEAVLKAITDIKMTKKKEFKDYLLKKENIEIDENSIIDVQVKRLHEYKRQQMNALYIIYKYMDIKAGNKPARPITFVFGAKAAPAYTIAKDIIHLILCLSKVIENDPEVSPYLKVVMLENYNVTYAEKIIPAADISEQISLASKEASGTSNMKFMLNGAVTLGTEDGANVEIHELVGDDNIYIFGEKSDTVIEHYAKADYSAEKIYDEDPEIAKLVDFIIDKKMFAVGNKKSLIRLYMEIVTKDWFMTLLDIKDYIRVKEQVFKDYEDRAAWSRKMIKNIAMAGFFSSDRTIAQYNDDIWHLD